MSGAMLQRLEFSDVPPELFALLEILDGAAEGLVGRANQLGRQRRAADIQRTLQDIPSVVGFAEHAVGGDGDLVEHDARRIMAIDHRRALELDALRFRIDEQYGDAARLPRL